MTQIILIRPGATDFVEQGRIQGTLDMPLCAQGNLEVAQIIEQLADAGIDALYCSDCEPARETADAIADALHIRAKKLDNLQNLNHGLWQGMLVDQVRRKHPKVFRQWQERPESVCPPEGEILSDAMWRIQTSLRKLLKRHKEGIVGLVVPEPLASLVRSYLQNTDVGDLWQACQEHGNWEIITIEPESLVQSR